MNNVPKIIEDDQELGFGGALAAAQRLSTGPPTTGAAKLAKKSFAEEREEAALTALQTRDKRKRLEAEARRKAKTTAGNGNKTGKRNAAVGDEGDDASDDDSGGESGQPVLKRPAAQLASKKSDDILEVYRDKAGKCPMPSVTSFPVDYNGGRIY